MVEVRLGVSRKIAGALWEVGVEVLEERRGADLRAPGLRKIA